MFKHRQFKQCLVVGVMVLLNGLVLIEPFNFKAQTMGPDRVKLHDSTLIERDVNIGNLIKYSFKFYGLDDSIPNSYQAQFMIMKEMSFTQYMCYYPNNPEKFYTSIIGLDDNPKSHKFKITAFDPEQKVNDPDSTNMTLENVEPLSDMTKYQIAKVKLKEEFVPNTYKPDGTRTYVYYHKIRSYIQTSGLTTSLDGQSYYPITLQFTMPSYYVDEINLADTIIIPFNNLIGTFSFSSPYIDITSTPVQKLKVNLGAGVTDTIDSQELELVARDEKGKIMGGLFKSTGSTDAYPNKLRVPMVSAGDGLRFGLFAYDSTWFCCGESWLRSNPSSNDWVRIRNSSGNNYNIQFNDKRSFLISLIPGADPTIDAYVLRKNSFIYNQVVLYGDHDSILVISNSIRYNNWFLQVIDSTHLRLYTNVPDYVNLYVHAPDTTVITRVWETPVQTMKGLKLFPNPAHEQLIIRAGDEGRHQLIIYDVLGRAVARASFEGREAVFDLLDLQAGAYCFNIDGKWEKFIKQ